MSSACLCMHSLLSLPSPYNISPTCALLHMLCKNDSYLHSLFILNPAFQIKTLPLLRSCSSDLWIEKQKEEPQRQTVGSDRPCISQSKGKDDLSLAVYFGKATGRMLEQLFYSCWQIPPLWIPVCHCNDTPLTHAGGLDVSKHCAV